MVEDEAGEIWHTTSKPLLSGTVVKGRVEAARRLDHMQQHSGQHLLSAVLASDFDLPTLSFHLGEQDATIDLAMPEGATEEKLREITAAAEQKVNEHIASNLPVSTRVIENAEAQSLLQAGALGKLPPREGPIRLVEMPGVDLNACGGTHVQALGEIGVVLLRETERVKKNLRLHFVCGLRAARVAAQDRLELAATAALLSVASSGVAAAVTRLQSEVKTLGKERQRLREEIAIRHAVQLAVEERIEGGLRLVCRTFHDRDADYIKLLAAKLLQAVPHTAAVLISTAEEPATVVVASNMVDGSELAKNCSNLLQGTLAPLKLRGGGSPELAQAQVPQALLKQVQTELISELTRG